MTSDMGEMFNEMKRERKAVKAKRRAEFTPGPEWKCHHETHYSRDLGGDRLDYWPGPQRFRWRGKTYSGDVHGFIRNREKSNG